MLASFGRVVAPLAIVAAAMFAAGDARAGGDNEGGQAAAESLFQEARKLMDAKKYGEACPKLAASHKLSPAVGTLLNLADCYEKDGKLASAWARFHEAVALAQRLGRPDREKTARDRADKLEPRLIKLSILAKENVEVKLDGNVLDPAVLGSPVPVDPGKHAIEASAKGKKPFTTTLEVSERTKSPSVEIPPLDPIPEEKKPPPPLTEPPAEERGSDGSTQRIIGVVGMGVGLAGVAVGTVFGLRTSSKWDEAKTHCNTALECDATGVELTETAKNAGTVSTIAFVAGGVLLAGGAVLFFTAPSRTPVRVGVGPGSVVVGGTF